jgi:hypothetical protein
MRENMFYVDICYIYMFRCFRVFLLFMRKHRFKSIELFKLQCEAAPTVQSSDCASSEK